MKIKRDTYSMLKELDQMIMSYCDDWPEDKIRNLRKEVKDRIQILFKMEEYINESISTSQHR